MENVCQQVRLSLLVRAASTTKRVSTLSHMPRISARLEHVVKLGLNLPVLGPGEGKKHRVRHALVLRDQGVQDNTVSDLWNPAPEPKKTYTGMMCVCASILQTIEQTMSQTPWHNDAYGRQLYFAIVRAKHLIDYMFNLCLQKKLF